MSKSKLHIHIHLILLLTLGSGSTEPIRSCPKGATDSQLNSCIATILDELHPRLAGGIPEIGLPPLDPFQFDAFDFEQGQGSVVVKATFTNILIRRLVNFNLLEFRIDTARKELGFHLQIPSIRIVGNYSLNGNVLFFPMRGTGPFWMDVYKLDVTGISHLVRVPSNVSDSSIVQTKKVDLDLKIGGIRMELMNLFNGNPLLGPVINRVLNENWVELYEEIKPKFTRQLSGIVKSISNAVIKELPFLIDYIQ